MQRRQLTDADKRRAFQCDQFDSVIERYHLTFPDPIGVQEDAETDAGDAEQADESVSFCDSDLSEGLFGKAIDTVKRAQTAVGAFQGTKHAHLRAGTRDRPVKSAGPRVGIETIGRSYRGDIKITHSRVTKT